MESAIGFAGYSTDGTWTIRYAYQSLELEGSKSHAIPANPVLAAGHSLNGFMNYEASGAELTVGYTVYQDTSELDASACPYKYLFQA